MRKLYLLSIIIIICKSSFAIIDTLRHYNPAASNYAYTMNANNVYFARFEPHAPGFVKQIIIKLGGTSANGTVRLSFYSHEAGTSFPQLIDTLFPSIVIHKTHTGVEKVVVNLPQTLWYDNNQFFIGISKVSTNVKVMCDNTAAAYSCTSSDGGNFYYMFYYSGTQPYLGPKKAFAIDVVMDCPVITSQNFFKLVNTSSGIGTAYSSGSGAWSDYNNDGYIDLLTNNKLYKNNGNGTFTDVTISSGLIGNSTRGIVFTDMNNDGNMDIITLGESGSGGNLCYEYINDGTGHFIQDTLTTIPNLTSVSAVCVADANNDKYPDLFIGQLWNPYPVPQPNFFMINNQSNGFIDLTTQIYPQHDGTYNWPNAAWDPANYVYEKNRNNRGAEWVDFNNDGKMDLYVTNYFLQKDEIYKNNGNGSFTDVFSNTIIDKNTGGGSNHGTGVDWGDYDNDGDMDLLLPQFAHPQYAIQYYHRGTTIYKNNGIAPNYYSFTDTRGNTGHLSYGAQGIQFEETHGGGAWGDYDNDGLPDFAITAFYGCRYVDVYHQKPDHTFELKTFELGSINTLNTADEIAWVDYDNDGKLDLCVGMGCYLYHNEFPSNNNWVEFDLVSSSGNHFGIGGRVTVFAGGQKYLREITAGRGELAQNPSRVHFGIGTASQIDSVLVRWSNGTTNTEKFCVTSVNNIYTLTEGSGGIASPLITATGNTNICQGNTVSLHVIYNPNLTYQWKLNGTNIANANQPYFSANQSGAYSVEISNGTYCTAVSNVISVVVNSLPIVDAGANIVISQGTDTFLLANSSGGSGFYLYNWAPSDSLISSNIQNPQTVNLYSSNIFSLTVTDSTTGCKNIDNVSVLVSGGNLSANCLAIPLTICKDSTQLLVLPTGGTGNYTYSWNNSALLNDTSISNPVAIISSTTTFSVTVSDGSEQTVSQITISPNLLPSVNITNSGSNTFCQGVVTQISSNSVSGINYQWLRNGIEIYGDTNQIYNVLQSGIYKIQITDSLGCSKTSDTLNITVLPAPTAKIIQTGVASICQGETFTFLVDSAAGLSYQWQLNGSNISGQTGTSYSANQSGLYSVVVSNNMCTDTSSQVQLYVHSLPNATINNQDTSFCFGQSVVLNTNLVTGLTYQWEKNGTNIINAYDTSYTANQAGAYTLEVSNGNCTSISNLVNVIVYQNPVASINNAVDTSFCQGLQYSLNADTVSGYSYQWVWNGNNISGETNNSINILQQGAYKLIVSQNGCTDTSNSVNIIFMLLPQAQIINNSDTTICPGDSITLFTNLTSGYIYQWLKNDTIISGAIDTAYTIKQTGSYSIIVTNTNNCSDTSLTTTVNVSYPPAPTITQNGDTLTSDSPTGNQWYLNSEIILGATEQTLIISQTGNYQLVVTINNCPSLITDTATYHYSGIINNLSDKFYLNIFPNPNKGLFTIELYSPVNDNFNFKIVNALGQEIFNHEFIINGKVAKTVDLEKFESGIYFIILKSNNGVDIKRKVVKL